MYCWIKFILFMIFLFPIITIFRLAFSLPYLILSLIQGNFYHLASKAIKLPFSLLMSDMIGWMRFIFALPYFMVNLILQVTFLPLFPLMWWIGLLIFAVKDKDNPTKISLKPSKRIPSILAFDSRLCI